MSPYLSPVSYTGPVAENEFGFTLYTAVSILLVALIFIIPMCVFHTRKLRMVQ